MYIYIYIYICIYVHVYVHILMTVMSKLYIIYYAYINMKRERESCRTCSRAMCAVQRLEKSTCDFSSSESATVRCLTARSYCSDLKSSIAT